VAAAVVVVADGLLQRSGRVVTVRVHQRPHGVQRGPPVRADGLDQVQVVERHQRRHRVGRQEPIRVAAEIQLVEARLAGKDENGRKRSETDLRYGKTKTVGSEYFYI
jgi:hypothetical protein